MFVVEIQGADESVDGGAFKSAFACGEVSYMFADDLAQVTQGHATFRTVDGVGGNKDVGLFTTKQTFLEVVRNIDDSIRFTIVDVGHSLGV